MDKTVRPLKEVNKIEVVSRIKKAKNITIVSHKNPDVDAIASSLAMHFICKEIKINSSVISYDKPSKILKSLPHIDEVYFEMTNDKLQEKDVLIILDSGDINRIGEIKDIFAEYKEVIFIDHHKVGDLSGVTMLYNNMQAAATGEIVFDLFFNDEYYKISKEVATLLYSAIATDTGNFIYTNTTKNTMLACSWLLDYGADLLSISSVLKVRYDKEDILLLTEIYNSINIFDDERIACIYSDKKNEINISLTETVMLIDTVRIGFVIRLRDNKFRVSLRSRSEKDIRPIAEKFGGGGHKKAAGFEVSTSKYTKEALIDFLYKETKKLLDE